MDAPFVRGLFVAVLALVLHHRPVFAQSAADGLLSDATAAEARCDRSALSLYFQSAVSAWSDLERDLKREGVQAARGSSSATYRHALLGLVRTAHTFNAWDAAAGQVRISDDQAISLRLVAQPWTLADFAKLVPAANFRNKEVTNHYSDWGVGAAMLAVRMEQPGEQFAPPVWPIVTTVLLRPAAEGPHQGKWTLELINSLALAKTHIAGIETPLERDQSAAFAFIFNLETKNYFRGFVNPSEPDVRPRVFRLEPYQQGKIPVVFAHGLYSQPSTWLDAANELMRKPEFYQRYQVWGFRYPTGGAFLESSTAFRHQTIALLQECDPANADPALNEMVLVGHSMGGLISKMLVTSSCNILWSRLARVPFDEVRSTPQFREKMRPAFFFEPIPNVSRIVYIASPHGGSPLANRPLALVGSSLVRYGAEEEAEFAQFIRDNRGVLTSYYRFRSTRPSTIDLLRPGNPLLEALGEMPVSPRVRTHTIVGEGYFFPVMRHGDTVVPIRSARLPDVESEIFVKAKHTKIHRTMDTVLEVERILDEHYAEARPRLTARPIPAANAK